MTIAHSNVWNGAEPIAGPGSIAIIGGGASGVLMAAHLLRGGQADIEVTIVEKKPSLGRGLAYSTDLPDHLLNVRASNMSAFADDPDHFVRWLSSCGMEVEDATTCFAPRRLYGEYLGQLLDRTRSSGALKIVANECTEVVEHGAAVELRMADGSRVVAESCIVATGHDERPCRGEPIVPSHITSWDEPVDPSDAVLIRGTGLSMVDACLSLILRGHTGPIYAVSRRGLLPAVHAKTAPVVFSRSDIPLGTDLVTFVRWFRDKVRSVEAAGGDWRDVVDGLRPFNQLIWQNWPEDAKRRFFRHMKAWWDIHRHRMAPQIFTRLAGAIAEGQLRVIAGRLVAVEPDADGDGAVASVQHRTSKRIEELKVTRIFECAGVIADPARSTNPAIKSLLTRGAARPDRLNIGLDVTPEGSLIGRDGRCSDRLYAIGPLTRGAFLEIEAVPDIRVQCHNLAGALVRQRA